MTFASSRPRTANRCTPLSETQLEHVRGGATAQAQSVSEDSATEVMNNPLYLGAGMEGANPLFEV
jgi:hypothetical protein